MPIIYFLFIKQSNNMSEWGWLGWDPIHGQHTHSRVCSNSPLSHVTCYMQYSTIFNLCFSGQSPRWINCSPKKKTNHLGTKGLNIGEEHAPMLLCLFKWLKYTYFWNKAIYSLEVENPKVFQINFYLLRRSCQLVTYHSI